MGCKCRGGGGGLNKIWPKTKPISLVKHLLELTFKKIYKNIIKIQLNSIFQHFISIYQAFSRPGK